MGILFSSNIFLSLFRMQQAFEEVFHVSLHFYYNMYYYNMLYVKT